MEDWRCRFEAKEQAHGKAIEALEAELEVAKLKVRQGV